MEARDRVEELTATQPLAVLATADEGAPYCSLVAIGVAGPAEIVFATTRTSHKWANLCAEPRVSLLLDNRTNQPSDFGDAYAATATGVASECLGESAERARGVLLDRHPHLDAFLAADSTALVSVNVERWYVVDRFQHVERYDPR